MIISFAWTTDAFRRREKTVTRRFWKPTHAARFHPGRVVAAFDKDPRAGGKRIGTVRIVSVRQEPLRRLVEDRGYAAREMVLEGDLWGSVEGFIGLLSTDFNPDAAPYRVEFEILEVFE